MKFSSFKNSRGLQRIQLSYFILMATLLFLAFSGNSQAKKNDYVIECRGGGSMFARVSVHYRNWVTIYGMKHSRYAASTRAPNAGECAWLDRPISNKEPYKIWYGVKTENLIHHVDISSRKVNLKWKPSPITTIVEKMRTGKIFYLHVKTISASDGPSFQITRVGP